MSGLELAQVRGANLQVLRRCPNSRPDPSDIEVRLVRFLDDGVGGGALSVPEAAPAGHPVGLGRAATKNCPNPAHSIEIYIMNEDGSDQKRLTTHPATDFDPCFSPDGTKIVFGSHRDSNTNVYIMNAEGSDQRRLTVYFHTQVSNAKFLPSRSVTSRFGQG